jgi:flagellar basal-body rod protein FlgF
MDRLAYTAASGIEQSANLQQMLANEISNISTPGFKKSLSNAVLASRRVDGPGFDTRFPPVSPRDGSVPLTSGPIQYTGQPLDVAMQGNTVLGVTAANGDLAFTRRGDLRVNAAGQIETGSGNLVQGVAGPINVPLGSSVTISGDGTIFAASADRTQNAAPVQVGRLLLRDASATVLKRREDGLLSPMDSPTGPGADIVDGAEAPSITVGSIEGSNVSISESIVRMITLSRYYEAGVKLIKESKDIDTSGASMMKLA